MKVKLLSLWLGPLPAWWDKYVAQWERFALVDWECILPPGDSVSQQVRWLNDLATQRLGFPCNKGSETLNEVCDYRPAYAELFPECYDGCDWWGWVDLDMILGDLDGMLPDLMVGADLVNFKPEYLSGCLVLLRNTPESRSLFRQGQYEAVLGDLRYHCWDESGYHYLGLEESFWEIIKRAGLKVSQAEKFYCYDTKAEPCAVKLVNGKLINLGRNDQEMKSDEPPAGSEVPFCHFMTDRWPITDDGLSRYSWARRR